MHYFRCVMSEVADKAVNPFQYAADDVVAMVQENPEQLIALFTQFSTRYLHIGQLGIERNTFINWEKGGLIPFEREEKGWRKFSFLEAVWIKTLEELRTLGVSTDTIRIVKDHLWAEGQSSFYDLILENIH
ncbi:MAG: MerR family transcriptional regulator, partial [Chitinophagaceae bacterium]